MKFTLMHLEIPCNWEIIRIIYVDIYNDSFKNTEYIDVIIVTISTANK